MREARINTPLQNNRYRGPIESVKLQNSFLMLSQAIRNIESKTNELQAELERMHSQSNILQLKIYNEVSDICL